MQKIAQKRTIWNKIREMTNVSGKAAEKFFNPEFKKVMTSLRKVDNNLRSIVAGESIGTEKDSDTGEEVSGDPGKYQVSMKQLIKQIRSNLNKREYMSATADLARFQAKLFEMANQIYGLNDKVDEVHHQFLFGTKDKPALTEEQWEHLQDLKKRYEEVKKAHNRQQRMGMIKQAGIVDFLKNIGTPRGRGLAAWEKRYPKQTQKLKKDSEKMLKDSESLQNFTLSALKEMASARSVRNPDVYMKKALELAKKYEVYEAAFAQFYKENIKGFLEKAESLYPSKEVKDNKELGKQEINVSGNPPVGTVPDLNLPTQTPTVPDLNLPKTPTPAATAPPAVAPPTAPPPEEEEAPPTLRTGPPEQMPLPFEKEVKTYKKFYESLQTMSKEDPRILASFINKFARSIQSNDPVTALKLFKIANSVQR